MYLNNLLVWIKGNHICSEQCVTNRVMLRVKVHMIGYVRVNCEPQKRNECYEVKKRRAVILLAN